MTVAELIDILLNQDLDAEVIINRDSRNFGFGKLNFIRSGIFQETDFGNDFHSDENIVINTKEIKAICIYPEDNLPEYIEIKDEKMQ